MSNPIVSSAGSARARDGISIAYTLHATSSPHGSRSRPRVALIHSLALDRSLWDGVDASPDATLSVLKNVRHLTPIECPALIAEKILALVERAR